jgi:putative OPT family oligopeptide transporter
VGGVHSIWSVRKGIVAGVGSLAGIGQDGSTPLRTERNLPSVALMTIFGLTVVTTFFFYDSMLGSYGLAGITVLVMVLCAFLFVAVATYIAGLVGSSNSPVSGMTICALLISAGVLTALGVKGDSAILATLGIAGVVCCATCTSGDVAQDLKTGLLVGATPARQQFASFIGVLVPAFFFAPILTLLHKAYGIGDGLAAPQAGLFASLADGFFGDGDLPLDMIAIGAAVGVALLLANWALEHSGVSFRAHVMPVAVGIYLPFSVAPPLLIGGIVRYFVTRGRTEDDANEASDGGVLMSSGLIAGEALVGILLAAFIAADIALPEISVPAVFSLAAFAGVTWLLMRAARR